MIAQLFLPVIDAENTTLKFALVAKLHDGCLDIRLR